MNTPISFDVVEGTPTFTIKFELLDLKNCTKQGLELLFQMALIDEQYERCQLIINELNLRKS